MKIPVMIQMQNGENAATALCMMLGYFGRFVPICDMREVCVSSRNGSSPQQIADAALVYGLETEIRNMTVPELRNQEFPVMVRWKRRYYCLIESIRGDLVRIVDPARGTYGIRLEKFEQLFSGTVLVFRKTKEFQAGGRRETLFSQISSRLKTLRGPMAVMLVYTAGCIALNVFMMNLEKQILDRHMGGRTAVVSDGAEGLIRYYAAAMVLYVMFSILKTRHVDRSSRKASAVSGIRLFKNIFRQPLRFFEEHSAYDLISRMENNITLDNSILKAVVPRSIDMMMSIVYLIYLFRYQPFIAGICALLVAGSVFSSTLVQNKRAIASRSMVTNGNSVNASLLNGMNMIDTIQASGAEHSFYNMWYRSQYRYQKNRMVQFRYSAVSNLISMLSQNLLQAVLLFMGAYFVVHGNITLGGMSLFQGILGNMITSVNRCVGSVDMLQTMRTNIERIDDINSRATRPRLSPRTDTMENVDKLEGGLSARDICYRYHAGDRLTLDHVSIEVRPGQMVAIVGESGCGKSTLIKVLSDLYQPESGEIFYAGRCREEIPDEVFYSSVSGVDQETMMFEDSVYNNIKMWDSTIQDYEVILAARDAQIHERISREKKNYSVRMKENGRNFSGGELQRIELARALAHEPTLLFLDEFTSALDARTEDRAMKALREKGTTCVIVAHRLSTIVDCDRIYVMEHGRIVQQGTHEELYAQEGLYRTLIG